MMCGVFLAPLAAAEREHLVAQGDTLYSISRHYGVKLEELCALNQISDGATLKVGQKLVLDKTGLDKTGSNTEKMPEKQKPQTYRAERGDTLYSIARKFEVSLADLLAVNNLNDRSVLKAEQKLRIPGGTLMEEPVAENWITTLRGASSTGSAISPARSALWPVATTKVTYVTGKLTGVQFATRENDSVSSVSSGTVIYSGEYRGFGAVIFVTTDPVYVYVYTGLGSLAVKTGDKVTVGTHLGRTGSDDGTTRPTFMVYRNGNPIDPATAPRL
jgi:LysM repeat protein